MKRLLPASLSALLLAPGLLRAEEGKLAAFEKGLEAKPVAAAPASETGKSSAGAKDDEDEEKEGWTNTFGEILVLSVLYGGMESLASVSPQHWGFTTTSDSAETSTTAERKVSICYVDDCIG